MKYSITIPSGIERDVRRHLFQNKLEQGAFLFARVAEGRDRIVLGVEDAYLVPPEGWRIQTEIHLEMKDEERAKIMKRARDRVRAVVDCHSHPGSWGDVWFSPSDIGGISEFAMYAKWKLDGKPYAAMVWGESSVDGVVWHSDFEAAQSIGQFLIQDRGNRILIPLGSWFSRRTRMWDR